MPKIETKITDDYGFLFQRSHLGWSVVPSDTELSDNSKKTSHFSIGQLANMKMAHFENMPLGMFLNVQQLIKTPPASTVYGYSNISNSCNDQEHSTWEEFSDEEDFLTWEAKLKKEENEWNCDAGANSTRWYNITMYSLSDLVKSEDEIASMPPQMLIRALAQLETRNLIATMLADAQSSD